MKTAELTGSALDWAVAKIEKHRIDVHKSKHYTELRSLDLTQVHDDDWVLWNPSDDWAQGGPIIERTCASVFFDVKDASYAGHPDEPWFCEMSDMGGMWHGQTPLIAAMRCYVASKLGDTVEIPEELIKC